MLNILQIEDRLKDMSEDVIKRMVTQPDSSVPPFLATNELNRRDRMRKEFQMRQAQDVPTVAEQLVAGAGMPNEAMSQMAMNMAPKSDISGNTGLEAMMPKETMPETEEDEVMMMEDEEPLGMNFGGLINSRFGGMAAPLAASMITPRPGLNRQVTDMRYRPLPNERLNQSQIARQGYSGGLGGLGSDIMGRVSEKSRGDVDGFLGEVEGMAEDRFDIDLSQQQRQIGMSGKGQLVRRAMPAMNSMPAIPFAMNEGGLASMSNGGDIEYKGFIQRALEKMMPSRFNMQSTASASPNESTVVTGGSPYETDENRTQMSPIADDKDDNDPPPPPKTTAAPSAFDNILSMIQEDRESAKEQRDRDRYLALMQFGLNLAKRGQLEDTGEGLKTLAMSNKAYQDQLGKLRALDVNALLTKEGIAGRERAAGITAQAALARAMAKGGLDEKELAKLVDDYASRIQKYDDQLGGVDGMTMSPDKKAEILELRKRTLENYNYYDGLLESKRGSKDITKTVYGG
tara:strand:- start:1892 stop:3436 length:1545 start_codon:yes stop_codon:yes gene_type:complete